MSVVHKIVKHEGRVIGHAISLGLRFEFYPAVEALSHMRGRRFDSLAAMRRGAIAALEGSVPDRAGTKPDSAPERSSNAVRHTLAH